MFTTVLVYLFVEGIVRITITVIVRAVILTPFAWAVSLATGVAQRIDHEMTQRAENPDYPGRVFLDLAQAQKKKEGCAGALRVLKGLPKEDLEPGAPEGSPMV